MGATTGPTRPVIAYEPSAPLASSASAAVPPHAPKTVRCYVSAVAPAENASLALHLCDGHGEPFWAKAPPGFSKRCSAVRRLEIGQPKQGCYMASSRCAAHRTRHATV